MAIAILSLQRSPGTQQRRNRVSLAEERRDSQRRSALQSQGAPSNQAALPSALKNDLPINSWNHFGICTLETGKGS